MLNGFGYDIVPKKDSPKPISFSEEECFLLGKIEHSRWLADRILEGWRFEAGSKQNDLKTNPLLVEWSKLSEDAKKGNIDQMRDLPEILYTCNLKLEKII